MINYEDEEVKSNFLSKDLLKVIVAIVLALIFTITVINFIQFSDMLDSFKLSFKTETMDKIVKYYSLTLAMIIIPIYTVFYFGIHVLIKFICKKINLKKEEE